MKIGSAPDRLPIPPAGLAPPAGEPEGFEALLGPPAPAHRPKPARRPPAEARAAAPQLLAAASGLPAADPPPASATAGPGLPAAIPPGPLAAPLAPHSPLGAPLSSADAAPGRPPTLATPAPDPSSDTLTPRALVPPAPDARAREPAVHPVALVAPAVALPPGRPTPDTPIRRSDPVASGRALPPPDQPDPHAGLALPLLAPSGLVANTRSRNPALAAVAPPRPEAARGLPPVRLLDTGEAGWWPPALAESRKATAGAPLSPTPAAPLALPQDPERSVNESAPDPSLPEPPLPSPELGEPLPAAHLAAIDVAVSRSGRLDIRLAVASEAAQARLARLTEALAADLGAIAARLDSIHVELAPPPIESGSTGGAFGQPPAGRNGPGGQQEEQCPAPPPATGSQAAHVAAAPGRRGGRIDALA